MSEHRPRRLLLLVLLLAGCIDSAVIGEQELPPPQRQAQPAEDGGTQPPPTSDAPDEEAPPKTPQDASLSMAMEADGGTPPDDGDSGVPGAEPACLPSEGCYPCVLDSDCPFDQPICAQDRCRICQDHLECLNGYCDDDGHCERVDQEREDDED